MHGRAYLVLLAEAAGHTGQVTEGLRLLAEALTALEAKRAGATCWQRRYRLQGELLLRQAVPDARPRRKPASSRPSPLPAASRPNPGSCVPPEPESAVAAAGQAGRSAYELLAPIYGWFTEGFDTADLQEAKALLEALGV